MQKKFGRTHINERFQERYGREFTKRDRENIITLVSLGKATIRESKRDKTKYAIYCDYCGIPSIFIVSKDMDFITHILDKKTAYVY